MMFDDEMLINNLYYGSRNINTAIDYLRDRFEYWNTMTNDEAIKEIAKKVVHFVGGSSKEDMEKHVNEFFEVYHGIFGTINRNRPNTTGEFFPPERFAYYSIIFYQLCG